MEAAEPGSSPSNRDGPKNASVSPFHLRDTRRGLLGSQTSVHSPKREQPWEAQKDLSGGGSQPREGVGVPGKWAGAQVTTA